MSTCPICYKQHKNPKFCSRKCFSESIKIIRKIVKCPYCNIEHTNPKFCSQQCAIIYNGKLRRPKLKKCKTCDSVTVRYDRTYCGECFGGKNKDMTIEQSSNGRVDANKYNKIRFRARTLAKQKNLLNECYNCKYNKHVECCHIKDISDFDNETMLSIVNAESNLVGLCPNCHWEFDNGLLKITK